MKSLCLLPILAMGLFSKNQHCLINKIVTTEKTGNDSIDNDAANWTGLNDLKTIQIGYKSFADIYISTNWFATTIVSGYTANSNGINERLITYANSLDASSKTLSESTIYQVL